MSEALILRNPMNLIQSLSSCPTSFKSRFSRRFLRALMKTKTETSSSSSSTAPTRVKTAADKSMALAVGAGRAWSRAMLWKIHQQHKVAGRRRRRFVAVRRINRIVHHKRSLLSDKQKKKKKKKKKRDDGGLCHANELRKLVPGGKAMDLCSLLDETAHYLKCLVTQVQVMKSIDQLYSI